MAVETAVIESHTGVTATTAPSKKCRCSCEEEVIVQGDEGPVCGVAQVVDCHGVTVSRDEREEEVEEQQEVESDEEKTLKERCAFPWMG